MRWLLFLCVTGAAGFAQNESSENKPVLVRELNDNIRVRLVGARTSETRGRFMSASVVPHPDGVLFSAARARVTLASRSFADFVHRKP